MIRELPEIKPVSPENEMDHLERLPARMACDVAIVGYGPVGMILSSLLAQRGLRIIVVERFPKRYALGRAGHFDGETFRTFQRLGIAEEMELLARPMLQWQMVTVEREVLATMKLGESGTGWKSSYLSYQPEFEVVFDAKVRELGVRIFMGLTATGILQDEHGAHLEVRPTDESRTDTCTIDASLIVGTDGAKSFVRECIGVKRRDLGFKANDQLAIDFEHNDPDRDLPQLPEVYQVLDIEAMQLAGRWSGPRWSRWEFHAREGESRQHLSSEETAWKLLAKWNIFPSDGRIGRHAVHSFESMLAEKWRVGRVLLAGDAAHTMPPFMGQGLCSGIRDALNLSWKIPAFLAGDASEEFLDTYESERAPHVQRVIEMSSGMGKMVLITDPEEARARDERLRSGLVPRAPVFPGLGAGLVRSADSPDAHPSDGRPSIQGRVARGRQVDRLDEFLRLGWKIVSRHPVPPSLFDQRQLELMSQLDLETAHVSRGASAQYGDIDGEYDLWYRNTGRKAFLIRPDNYVFGSVTTMEQLPALIDELAGSLARHGWRGHEHRD